jgi:hypothetical protein
VRVELHPGADAEFAAAIRSYNKKVPGLGVRFYTEVMARLEWILANSQTPRIRGAYRRVNLHRFPYYIAYAIDGDLISVAPIANSYRKPEYWKARLKGF